MASSINKNVMMKFLIDFYIATAVPSSDYVSDKVFFSPFDNCSVLQTAPHHFSHMLHYGLA